MVQFNTKVRMASPRPAPEKRVDPKALFGHYPPSRTGGAGASVPRCSGSLQPSPSITGLPTRGTGELLGYCASTARPSGGDWISGCKRACRSRSGQTSQTGTWREFGWPLPRNGAFLGRLITNGTAGGKKTSKLGTEAPKALSYTARRARPFLTPRDDSHSHSCAQPRFSSDYSPSAMNPRKRRHPQPIGHP
jgi:hypothetical protein